MKTKTKTSRSAPSKAMPKMSMAQHKKMIGKGEEKGEYGKGVKKTKAEERGEYGKGGKRGM